MFAIGDDETRWHVHYKLVKITLNCPIISRDKSAKLYLVKVQTVSVADDCDDSFYSRYFGLSTWSTWVSTSTPTHYTSMVVLWCAVAVHSKIKSLRLYTCLFECLKS